MPDNHPHDDSDAETKDRPPCKKDESALAMRCEAPLDHHIEELLAAFDELARRYG